MHRKDGDENIHCLCHHPPRHQPPRLCSDIKASSSRKSQDQGIIFAEHYWCRNFAEHYWCGKRCLQWFVFFFDISLLSVPVPCLSCLIMSSHSYFHIGQEKLVKLTELQKRRQYFMRPTLCSVLPASHPASQGLVSFTARSLSGRNRINKWTRTDLQMVLLSTVKKYSMFHEFTMM